MQEEFLKYYNLYKNDVLRLAMSYTGKIVDAEDITQNVFIKLYQNIDKLKDKEYIKKWCFRVTINECKNFNLSYWKRKISQFDDNKINDYSYDFEDDILKDQIFKLPKKERVVFYLYYYAGYKVKEIAEILKQKEPAINYLLKKAKDYLKNNYERN